MPIIYKGRVFSVEVDMRRFPDGRDHEVAVVRHPASVVLIPIEHDGRLVLIKQYRASVDRELWELPADLQRVLDELRERFDPALHEP